MLVPTTALRSRWTGVAPLLAPGGGWPAPVAAAAHAVVGRHVAGWNVVPVAARAARAARAAWAAWAASGHAWHAGAAAARVSLPVVVLRRLVCKKKEDEKMRRGN